MIAPLFAETITKSFRLPTCASIFTAEALAIYKAIKYIKICLWKDSVTFSDSENVLQALTNQNVSIHPLVGKIKMLLIQLHSHNSRMKFCCVLCYVQIPGNKKADDAARNVRELSLATSRVPFTDFKELVNQHIHDEETSHLSQLTKYKLYAL